MHENAFKKSFFCMSMAAVMIGRLSVRLTGKMTKIEICL